MYLSSAFHDHSTPQRYLEAVPAPAPSRPLPPVVKRLHGREEFVVPTVSEPEQHPSGWDVEVELAGDGRVWRSGETLQGKVELRKRDGCEQQQVSSLSVRCFWQSTIVYCTFSESSSFSSPSTPAYVERAEYHRGYAPTNGEGLELPLDTTESSSSSPSPSSVFHFAFTLSRTTHSSFSNPSWCPPSSRAELMKFERCAPPSFDNLDATNGRVEWVVEVLLRTELPGAGGAPLGSPPSSADELPPFDPAPSASGELSSRGLLRSTPSVLVKRITFPFQPLDRFVEDYQSSWYDAAAPLCPSFGRDSRDELTATKRVEPAEMAEDRLVVMDGGEEKWLTYYEEVAVKTSALALGKKSTILRAEISFPNPLIVPRTATAIPFLLHLRHFFPPPSRIKSLLPFGSPSSSAASPTPPIVKLESITLTLVERILKRGGSAVRPVMDLKTILVEEIPLGPRGADLSRESTSSSSSKTSKPRSGSKRKKQTLRLSASPSSSSPSPAAHLTSFDPSVPPASVDLRLSYSLDGLISPLTLTFRTPNLEREYVLSATLKVVGMPAFVIARVPVQVVTGEDGGDEVIVSSEDIEEEDVGIEEVATEENGGRVREKLPLYAQHIEDVDKKQ